MKMIAAENMGGLVRLTLDEHKNIKGEPEQLDSIEGTVTSKKDTVVLLSSPSTDRLLQAITLIPQKSDKHKTAYVLPYYSTDGKMVRLRIRDIVTLYFDNHNDYADLFSSKMDAKTLLVRDDVAGAEVISEEGQVISKYLFRDPETYKFLETHNSPIKYVTRTDGTNRDPLTTRDD